MQFWWCLVEVLSAVLVVFGGGPQYSSGGVWWRSSAQFWWCLVEVLSTVLVVFGGGSQCSSGGVWWRSLLQFCARKSPSMCAQKVSVRSFPEATLELACDWILTSGQPHTLDDSRPVSQYEIHPGRRHPLEQFQLVSCLDFNVCHPRRVNSGRWQPLKQFQLVSNWILTSCQPHRESGRQLRSVATFGAAPVYSGGLQCD